MAQHMRWQAHIIPHCETQAPVISRPRDFYSDSSDSGAWPAIFL